MSPSTGHRSRFAVIGVAAAIVLLPLLLLVGGSRWLAASLEVAARDAWQQTLPMEALARPVDPRAANGAALALERAAAPLGFSLAPLASARAAPAAVEETAAALTTLHADLTGLLAGDPKALLAPALAAWLEKTRGALDALAVDLAGGESPRWESPTGRSVTRSPPPLERCDRLVLEAARLAALPPGKVLGEVDEHLTRPGSPRLDGVVLLEEALLLSALVDGRRGDVQRALRLVGACVRLEEGIATDASVVTLGVLANLARIRLAILRDLAPPVEDSIARQLIGPPLQARFRDAVIAEASSLARAPTEVERPRGAASRAMEWVFSGQSSARRASTLRHLQLIAQAAGPVTLTDADLSTLAATVSATAPPWDSIQAGYLFEIVGTWSRLRRVEVDAEFTRRLLAARVLMLGSGDVGAACRAIAEPASMSPPATFDCKADSAGHLMLILTSSSPGIGRPSAFEPPPSAPLMPPR